MVMKSFSSGEKIQAADFNDNFVETQKAENITNGTLNSARMPVDAFSGFNDSQTITASNASWPVPTLAYPIVKVTVVGGGGGGPGIQGGGSPGNGGTTTFNAGGAGSISATGGQSGYGASNGKAGTAGMAAANGGGAASANLRTDAKPGLGGEIRSAYFDLTGISTVNITVGGGGSGQNLGGRGECVVEYRTP